MKKIIKVAILKKKKEGNYKRKLKIESRLEISKVDNNDIFQTKLHIMKNLLCKEIHI